MLLHAAMNLCPKAFSAKELRLGNGSFCNWRSSEESWVTLRPHLTIPPWNHAPRTGSRALHVQHRDRSAHR